MPSAGVVVTVIAIARAALAGSITRLGRDALVTRYSRCHPRLGITALSSTGFRSSPVRLIVRRRWLCRRAAITANWYMVVAMDDSSRVIAVVVPGVIEGSTAVVSLAAARSVVVGTAEALLVVTGTNSTRRVLSLLIATSVRRTSSRAVRYHAPDSTRSFTRASAARACTGTRLHSTARVLSNLGLEAGYSHRRLVQRGGNDPYFLRRH
ncbi:hypothetical protein ON010_g8663 [Phytophthora cinnamomi]|nr:hypothetical protein ON010_g8663 [Phytophthora cinnamomi]